jgi:hypothetical protein
MSDESERVKKHKRNRMKEGYTNISFMVSPEEFKEIKKARKSYKMSTRELLMYFISGKADITSIDSLYYDIYNSTTLTEDQKLQKGHENFGDAHKFKNKKDFVIIYLLSIDNKKIKFIKDFDTYEEALEYYKNYKTNKRIAIFEKNEFSKEGWYSLRYA